MNYYNEIKEKLINNEVYKKVKDYSKNRNDLQTYYDVGKLIVDAQGGEEKAKYGDGLIKEYSLRLTKELHRGYSVTSLKRMRQFYLLIQKGAPLMHQLTWTHYILLLPLENFSEVIYYIEITKKYNLSKRQLEERIKSKEYERLSEETKNKLSLNNTDKYEITDFVKNPIIIKNNLNTEKISEKVLQQLILEDIPSFLKELGVGFTFIDNEYPIKLGSRYNYIDILLFNYIYNLFVVVELKVTELKKEHIGQIQLYMNYIDGNLKTINQDKTIGIIIAREDNKYVMKYCSDERIYSTTYEMESV